MTDSFYDILFCMGNVQSSCKTDTTIHNIGDTKLSEIVISRELSPRKQNAAYHKISPENIYVSTLGYLHISRIGDSQAANVTSSRQRI